VEHQINRGRVIRAILDTSSLVPAGLRRDLQEAAQLDAFVGIWSPWVIAELNRVLTWLWIENKGNNQASERECSRQAKTMMEILLPSFELVAPLPPYPRAWESLTDQWDHPVWAAAKQGQALYVVSENSHDFPPRDGSGNHVHEGIEYVSGRVFLQEVLARELDEE
jgi:predicted nucleic acid-binding protein